MHAISDYESDAYIAENLEHPSHSRSDHELNLAVLKRQNREVVSLQHVSPYAVVYVFNAVSQEWEKSGIEGTTFVCGLAPNPQCDQRFSVMVLNRRGLDNFSVEVNSTGEVEVTDEYIIIQAERNGHLQVYGLWVYSEPPPSSTANDRDLTAAKIQECASKAELSRKLIQERDLNGYEAEMEEESAPTIRQSSSRQNSLQPKVHETVAPSGIASPNHSQLQPQSSSFFTVSADTEFFRSSRRYGAPTQEEQTASLTQEPSTLLDLFRNSSSY